MEIEMHAEKVTAESNGADHVVVNVKLERTNFIEMVQMAINAGDITLNEISN